MKIMKIILLLLSIFTVATASAESLLLPFEHAEPARGEVVPYGRAADALKAEPSASNYVAKLAQWTISEDGKEYNIYNINTLFSANVSLSEVSFIFSTYLSINY